MTKKKNKKRAVPKSVASPQHSETQSLPKPELPGRLLNKTKVKVVASALATLAGLIIAWLNFDFTYLRVSNKFIGTVNSADFANNALYVSVSLSNLGNQNIGVVKMRIVAEMDYDPSRKGRGYVITKYEELSPEVPFQLKPHDIQTVTLIAPLDPAFFATTTGDFSEYSVLPYVATYEIPDIFRNIRSHCDDRRHLVNVSLHILHANQQGSTLVSRLPIISTCLDNNQFTASSSYSTPVDLLNPQYAGNPFFTITLP